MMYICYMSTAGCRLGHVVAFAGAWTTHLCILNFHERIRIATSRKVETRLIVFARPAAAPASPAPAAHRIACHNAQVSRVCRCPRGTRRSLVTSITHHTHSIFSHASSVFFWSAARKSVCLCPAGAARSNPRPKKIEPPSSPCGAPCSLLAIVLFEVPPPEHWLERGLC